MTSSLSELAITILRPPPQRESDSLRTYASILRDLRLQEFRESAAFLKEEYSDVSSHPPLHWQNLVKHHNGLVQIVFGISPSLMPTIWAMAPSALQFDVIMDIGVPIAFAIHPGPVLSDQCLLPASSGFDTPSIQEISCLGSTIIHIAHERDSQRSHGRLFRNMMEDHDQWLLQRLRAIKNKSPAVVARICTIIKAGVDQDKLMSFYARDGWSISDTRKIKTAVPSGSGEAKSQGVDMGSGIVNGSDVLMEKVFTVDGLERRVADKNGALNRELARL